MLENQSSLPMISIYLVYGLAFFSLGLAVALEARRSATTGLVFARAMLPLAMFGLLHGAHEWLEMLMLELSRMNSAPVPLSLEIARIVLLALSFVSLIAFGARLLFANENGVYIAGGLFLFWLASVFVMGLVIQPGEALHLSVRSWLLMADTWSRYSLAIPGAMISAYALWRQARLLVQEQRRFARYLYIAAAIFVLYGAVGQLFVAETYLFPSNMINAAAFERTFGVPIQLLRAVFAIFLALTLIPALNMFELERQQALADAEQRARDELARREALRREMLRHTVAAQEEERRRIARELHDEIGQILTALSLGLESVLQKAQDVSKGLADQVKDLRSLTADSVAVLSNLVTDLRPSQLDHLGLAAAMRSLAQDYRRRFNLEVHLELAGQRRRLPPEVELAVFRIAQEALTNVVRHAQVDEAEVRLCFEAAYVELCICDGGVGFVFSDEPRSDTRKHWGILGMTERATQLGGDLQIESTPGQGARVIARLPVAQAALVDVEGTGDGTYSTG